jgi:hypothetical protein
VVVVVTGGAGVGGTVDAGLVVDTVLGRVVIDGGGNVVVTPRSAFKKFQIFVKSCPWTHGGFKAEKVAMRKIKNLWENQKLNLVN